MKKLILYAATAVCTLAANNQTNAQWTRNVVPVPAQTYLTNTGDNVGIGTTTPAYKLDIQSTSAATMSFKSTGGNASILLDRGAATNTASLTYRTAGVNNWQTGCVSNNNYTIRNNGLGQLTFYCDYLTNNIGIGTNVPANKLSVVGNANVDGTILVRNPSIVTNYGQLLNSSSGHTHIDTYGGGSTYLNFYSGGALYIGTGGVSGVGTSFLNNGNVGIGTSTPTSKLNVNGQLTIDQKNFGGYGGLLIKGNAPGSNFANIALSVLNNSNQDIIAGYIQGVPTNAAVGSESMDLGFYTSQAGLAGLVTRLYIKDNGNVGIGTSSPASNLDVVSTSSTGTSAVVRNTGTGNVGFELRSNGTATQFIDFQDGATGTQTPDYRNRIASTNSSLAFSTNTVANAMLLLNNGNVGIGASTPQAKLDVNGNIQISNASIPVGLMTEIGGFSPVLNTSVNFRETNKNNTYKGAAFRIDSRVGQPPFQWLYRPAGSTSEFINLVLDSAGNVGIGNTNPHAPLQFSNGTSNRKIVLYEGANNDNQFNGFGLNAGVLRYQVNNIGDAHVFYAGASPTSSNELMRVNGNGNVGIGTATPFYKLDVCGVIRANEVRVETGWCDYVFANDYKLPALKDVESFIKENKHLPDVTAGAEIESNGLEVGKVSSQMIKKIEELTLYIIEQEKAINKLADKNAALEAKMNSLVEKGGK